MFLIFAQWSFILFVGLNIMKTRIIYHNSSFFYLLFWLYNAFSPLWLNFLIRRACGIENRWHTNVKMQRRYDKRKRRKKFFGIESLPFLFLSGRPTKIHFNHHIFILPVSPNVLCSLFFASFSLFICSFSTRQSYTTCA